MMSFKRKVKFTTPEPAQKMYTLKALVIMGTELPNPTVLKKKVQIRISIGHHDATTEPMAWTAGLVKWDKLLMMDDLNFPVAGGQVCIDYTIFINRLYDIYY